MRKLTCIYIILIAFSLSIKVQAQQKNNEAQILQTDTIKVLKKTNIVVIPIAFYTPETNFGLGGGVQFMFNSLRNIFNSRLSDMLVTVVYTTKNQLLVDARPQIHIYEGEFYIDGHFQYKVFPNSFWGVGSDAPDEALEQYNMETFKVEAALLKRIPPSLNFGFEYNFEKHKMLEINPEGQMSDSTIPGSTGALISALSVVYNFDDRDNIFSPFSGNYLQMRAGFSSRVLGADYSYNKYVVDLRKYFSLTRKSVLACQYYLEFTFGDVPFQTKPWLGGGERNRGYFNGRYMDDHYHAIQLEYRLKLSPRWIVAGFASGGEVADQPGTLFEDLKVSYGGGIRFQISKKSPSLVRLDVGFGRPGNSGIYFGVNEAF